MQNQIIRRFTAAALLLCAGLTSCSKIDEPAPAGSGSGAPNTVSGTVLDPQGKPVAGARIRAENSNGNNIHVDGFTGADGKYSLQLTSIGGWNIYAWKEAEFAGRPYVFRMGMPSEADYGAFTPGNSGIVKNFVWKLSGRIPDRPASHENGSGYFGGTLRFVNFNSLTPEMPAGTVVTIRLSPAAGATFADGSPAAGKTVTKSFTIASGVSQVYYINDVPLTTYVMSATTSNGETVYLGADNRDDLFEKQEYTMPSAGSTGSYESGLGSPNGFSFYMGVD